MTQATQGHRQKRQKESSTMVMSCSETVLFAWCWGSRMGKGHLSQCDSWDHRGLKS